MAIPAPVFNRAAAHERATYESFFEQTKPDSIEQFATGSNLTDLVDCAWKIQTILIRCNPVFDTWRQNAVNLNEVTNARQWELERLSDVKQRLEQAIVQKRAYYENHWLGQITKFVLRLFCLWNEGNTAAIVAAEDFLLRWDLRMPVSKIGSSYEKVPFFTCLVPTEWYQQNLEIANFFNYDPPSRTIPVKGLAPADQPLPFMSRQIP